MTVASEEDIQNERNAKGRLNFALLNANNIYKKYSSLYAKIRTRESFDYIVDDIAYRCDYPVLAAGEVGRVSYARNEKDNFLSIKKTRTSLSRYIRRVLKIAPDRISDANLEAFQTAFNLAIKSNGELKNQINVLKGKDIQTFYAKTLIASCMTGEEKSEKILFFVNNSDIVSLVVIDELARALLWKTDVGYVLDNIYGPSFGVSILRKWAVECGYTLRENVYYKDFAIKAIFNPKMPYMDTFNRAYLSPDEKTIWLATDNKHIVNAVGSLPNIIITDNDVGWYYLKNRY